MEKDQEEKYVCKLCNKSFLNGKVLGGHMRSHISLNSAKENVKSKKIKMGVEADGYGLRENPKKSWKSSGSKENPTLLQENLCKMCGKGFESQRALFGHMRHHSRKEKKSIHCNECGKAFETLKALAGHKRWHYERIKVSNGAGASSIQKLTLDSHSESETAGFVRRKRSKRMRYKITQDYSFYELNQSSSVTEIVQEVEEAAICLMMLSRGVRDGDEFFWDNNSESFEVKLSNQCKRIAGSEHGDFGCDGDEYLRVEKLDSFVSDAINFWSKEFDSEAATEEEEEVGMEVPIERFYRGVEFKMPKLADEYGIVLSDAKTVKGVRREAKRKHVEVEMGEDLMEEVGLGQGGLETMKCYSSKKAKLDTCDPEMGIKSSNSSTICTTSDADIFHNSGKKREFNCKTCNKLGGRCTIHQRIPFALKNEGCEKNIQSNILPEIEANCKLAKLECGENSVKEVAAVKVSDLKKIKGYECPICFKVFASGQALGGHKRSHCLKFSETKEQNFAVKQELTETCSIFDLDFPANLEKQVPGDHPGFKQWWVGSGHKHEPLVGLYN